MVEFLELCFTSVNLPFTILLILVFIYWVFFIVGAVGLDSLDLDFDAFDLDADVDVDVDAHLDAHGGGHAGHSSGMFVSMLRFFNVGDIPLMIWATFFAFFSGLARLWFHIISIRNLASRSRQWHSFQI